jgi:hypothetical protein
VRNALRDLRPGRGSERFSCRRERNSARLRQGLTARGELVAIGPKGLRYLENAPRPPGDPTNVQQRVDAAIEKFRRRGSTSSDRRDAIRDLADILEFLRPQAKAVLTQQDESDLFNIANNFGIRHHNQRQKTHYDEAIWQSWMVYFFLATIHATTRLIEKSNTAPAKPGRVRRECDGLVAA